MFRQLNNNQLDRLSEFTANLGLVFFAAMVIPMFSGFDKIELFNVIFGLLLTIISLLVSLWIAKGAKS